MNHATSVVLTGRTEEQTEGHSNDQVCIFNVLIRILQQLTVPLSAVPTVETPYLNVSIVR